VGYSHRLLKRVLKDALENDLVVRNVMASKSAPTVKGIDKVIIRADDVSTFIEKMRPRIRYYAASILGLFCGLRLGATPGVRLKGNASTRSSLKVRGT